MKALLGVFVIGLLEGCATQLPYLYDRDQEDRLLAESLGEGRAETELIMLDLNDEIRADLDRRINRNWSKRRRLRELRAYLYGKDGLNIGYDASTTKSAIDAYETRASNCLGLTSLFIAAGRYVGLDAHYQTVKVRPIWDHVGNTVIRYEHIVATGELLGESYVIDFLPEFRIGNQQVRRISDREALVLFYNNLGAEKVVQGNPEEAIVILQKALALDAQHSNVWNNMGAALRRLRKNELAEFSYHRALLVEPNNYSALSNLERFYKAEGRGQEAEEVGLRVKKYRRRNPYFFYFIAKVLFAEGHYIEAISALDKAIRLKRDEPEFYAVMASYYAHVGDGNSQRKQLRLAEKYRQEPLFRPTETFESNRLLVKKN